MVRRCEAPVHAPDCDGTGSTRDHFTPRCIARELGWPPRRLGSPENAIYLSPQCHREKDRSTPAKLAQVRAQRRGVFLKLGDHK